MLRAVHSKPKRWLLAFVLRLLSCRVWTAVRSRSFDGSWFAVYRPRLRSRALHFM